MKNSALLIMMAGLMSCNVLRKDRFNLNRCLEEHEFLQENSFSTLHSQSGLKFADSNGGDFTMLVSPKGKFRFGVNGGFEGEASQLVIKGKQSRKQMLELGNILRQQSSNMKEQHAYSKETASVDSRHKARASLGWAWLVLLPIVYVLYRIYCRYLR
jgi:hypothetical protein